MRPKNSQIILGQARLVRDALWTKYQRSQGLCYDASCILGKRLEILGYTPKLAQGRLLLNNHRGEHFWLEINGKILDVTGDQFNSNLPETEQIPEILFSTYRIWSKYRKTFTLDIPVPYWSGWAMSIVEPQYIG